MKNVTRRSSYFPGHKQPHLLQTNGIVGVNMAMVVLALAEISIILTRFGAERISHPLLKSKDRDRFFLITALQKTIQFTAAAEPAAFNHGLV